MRFERMRLSSKEQLPLYVFVFVLFAAGAAFGVLMYNALTLEQQTKLGEEVGRYLRTMETGFGTGESPAFAERAMFHGKWLLLIWLLGLSVVGVPLIFALDFLKGVLVGFSAGALVTAQAVPWKGALLSALALAPPNLLVVPALLMASVSGMSFAVYVIRNRLVRKQGDLRAALLTHTVYSALLLLVLLAAALLETALSPVVLGWAAPYFAPGAMEAGL